MKSRALNVFEDALAGWVRAWKKESRYAGGIGDVSAVLSRLQARLGDDVLRRIGAGYILGQLADVPGRYLVRVTASDGPGFAMLSNESAAAPEVRPCWEMFVQLSEYVVDAGEEAREFAGESRKKDRGAHRVFGERRWSRRSLVRSSASFLR